MSYKAITFSATPELAERIEREVVRRTIERGRTTTRSQVIGEALERALRDDDAKAV